MNWFVYLIFSPKISLPINHKIKHRLRLSTCSPRPFIANISKWSCFSRQSCSNSSTVYWCTTQSPPTNYNAFFFLKWKKKKLLSNRQSPDCEYGLYGLTVYNFFGGSILLHVLNNCFFFCGFSILFPLSLKFLGL